MSWGYDEKNSYIFPSHVRYSLPMTINKNARYKLVSLVSSRRDEEVSPDCIIWWWLPCPSIWRDDSQSQTSIHMWPVGPTKRHQKKRAPIGSHRVPAPRKHTRNAPNGHVFLSTTEPMGFWWLFNIRGMGIETNKSSFQTIMSVSVKISFKEHWHDGGDGGAAYLWLGRVQCLWWT